jgi:outer membrane protein assembly factor BamB
MPSHAVRSVACSTLLAASLMGCASTDGSSGERGVPQVAAKIDHDAWGSLGYRLDWQGFPFAGVASNPGITFLTPSATHVLVQNKSSHVSLLETNTGARRWSVEFGSPLTRFVALGSDPAEPNRVFVSADSELFTVAAPTGNIIDREKFDRIVNTAPVLSNGLAIYGTSVGEILAHRPGATLKAWGYGTDSTIDANPVRLTDSVGFVTARGDVLLLSPDGALMGRNRILGTTSTNPVSNGAYMAVARLDQSLWCFDARGGLAWRLRQPAPLRVQPAALENLVVCELPETGLTAVEFDNGKVIWSNKTVHGTVIAANKNRLFVWDGTTASIVDAKRGDVLTSTLLPGVRFITTDQFDGGNLYAATSEGSVAKFRLRN